MGTSYHPFYHLLPPVFPFFSPPPLLPPLGMGCENMRTKKRPPFSPPPLLLSSTCQFKIVYCFPSFPFTTVHKHSRLVLWVPSFFSPFEWFSCRIGEASLPSPFFFQALLTGSKNDFLSTPPFISLSSFFNSITGYPQLTPFPSLFFPPFPHGYSHVVSMPFTCSPPPFFSAIHLMGTPQ